MTTEKNRSGFRLLWLLIPVLLFAFFGKPVSATEPATQTVTIHKLAFDTMPEERENTGDEMEWENAPPLKNAVFTAYDVTAAYWTAYDAASGSHEAKVSAAVAAVEGINTDGLTSFVFPATGDNGQASLNLAITSQSKNAIYLFKETTTPAGISESSPPFVLGLPVTNADGTNKSVVHVYPKNQYAANKLQFKKYGVEADGTIGVLANAKFKLKEQGGGYYTVTNNTFSATEADGSVLTSGTNGLVSLDGLILKDGATYEFYEIDSTVAISGLQTANPELFHYKTNPVVVAKVTRDPETAQLIIRYDYFDSRLQALTDQTEAKAYNYKVPDPSKEADDTDVDIGQTITYTLTQPIPNDVGQYSLFELRDSFDNRLELRSNAADIVASLLIDGVAVTDVTPVVADIAANPLVISFNPAALEPYAGQTLTLTIDFAVKPGADLGEAIDNTIAFNNDFFVKTDKETVKTYGKRFVKKDADTNQTLAGAEFVVKKGDLFLVVDDNGRVSFTTDQANATVYQTGADGVVMLSGLAKTDENGNDINYELVETKAPDGYVLPTSTVPFVADNGKIELIVVNKAKGLLPATGGIGIFGFIIAGLTLLGSTGYYFKKRHN